MKATMLRNLAFVVGMLIASQTNALGTGPTIEPGIESRGCRPLGAACTRSSQCCGPFASCNAITRRCS